jgi:hypothetical protein
MIVEPGDREIVRWAAERSLPCYYASERGLPDPCLKVHCGHVTAYFCRGRLSRLWAHADGACLDEMFAGLTDVFALCARMRTANSHLPLLTAVERRLAWDHPAW